MGWPKIQGVYRRPHAAIEPQTLASSPNAQREEAMRQLGPDTYLCTLCNSTIAVSGKERPVVMMAAESGQPNLRVVSVAGVEVHRCVIADQSSSVRVS
jgi:hypothetical protein